MFVDVNNNKYQIIITILIGFTYFYMTRNEINSFILVILLSLLLRYIKIDSIIKNIL